MKHKAVSQPNKAAIKLNNDKPFISLPEARLLLKAKERGLSDEDVTERMKVIDGLASMAIDLYKVHKSS